MIDWPQIDELRQEMGDAFPDLAQLFLAEVAAVADRLRETSPAPSLEADLHFLKGAALSFGFIELARHCSQGEALAAAGHDELVDLPTILLCYRQSREAFVAGLPGRPA